VRELEDQQVAQGESINSLEESIEEERRKGNAQSSPLKVRKDVQTLMKQVAEQRKVELISISSNDIVKASNSLS
jgi:hypothetical protein